MEGGPAGSRRSCGQEPALLRLALLGGAGAHGAVPAVLAVLALLRWCSSCRWSMKPSRNMFMLGLLSVLMVDMLLSLRRGQACTACAIVCTRHGSHSTVEAQARGPCAGAK